MARGEIVGLLGRNGVGRSTTLRAILGEVKPQGSIIFKATQIAGKPSHEIAKLGLAYVPENRDVFPSLTVKQNLMLGMKSMKHQGRWNMQEMFSLFPNLKARADILAGVLSGGEQQMLTMCRSLMGDPDLIMIDEPTEGLAPKMVIQIGELLHEISNRGISILLVEQKLAITLEISDRVYVMGHGKIVHECLAEELLENDEIRKEWLEAS